MEQINGVILEGHDSSGKTTLANKLSSFFGLSIFHHSYDASVKNHIEKYLFRINSNKKYIFDRSYISEIVYGYITRNTISISKYEKDFIENFLYLNRYCLILCDYKNFTKEFFFKKKCDFNFIQMQKIKKYYMEIFNIIRIPKIIVDPFTENIKNINEFIKNCYIGEKIWI